MFEPKRGHLGEKICPALDETYLIYIIWANAHNNPIPVANGDAVVHGTITAPDEAPKPIAKEVVMSGFDGAGPRGGGPVGGDAQRCRNGRGMAGPKRGGRGRRGAGCGSGPGRNAAVFRGNPGGSSESAPAPRERALLEAQAKALRERLASIETRLASTETF